MFMEYCTRKDLLRQLQREFATEMNEARKILSTANLNRRNTALLESLEADDLVETDEFIEFEEDFWEREGLVDSANEADMPLCEKHCKRKRKSGYEAGAFYSTVKENARSENKKKEKEKKQ